MTRESLRVLMVTSEWPTPDRPRTTNFIKRQAEFLRAAGVEVEVFHFHGGGRPLNYARAWLALRPQLDPSQYHLVHAQFGQSGLLALPKRLPLVVTFRGCDLLGIISDADGRPTRAGRLLQRVSRLVAARADAVILVSAHMRPAVRTDAPTHVIPSGLDLDLFRPVARHEARRRLGFDPDERLVLFVGRPHQARKRYALAREAVDLLSRRLPARLIVAWGVPHAEIPYYMSACDALVHTSMQEGSPNVVKEALACNLPVVSVPVGDVAERLRGVEGCELCVDERPGAIAAALERVLLRGGRINGRAAVAELDEGRLTARVVEVYQSVLRASHRRAAAYVSTAQAS
ncbi:MAG: glycosyltransferase family 4 protein [Gemmatimonadetes bacterium]|nr:glycosyltransferase family 4 protein [Gemmatimonadota bacterium]